MEQAELADLIQAMRSKDFNVSGSAIGKFLNELDYNTLISTLSHEDEVVRCHAVIALGNLGNTHAIEPILKMLNDPSSRVCSCALGMLVKLKATDAVEAITPILEGSAYNESWIESQRAAIRALAAEALGFLGDKSILPVLENAFQNDTGVTSRGITVREMALKSIKRLRKLTPEEAIYDLFIRHSDLIELEESRKE